MKKQTQTKLVIVIAGLIIVLSQLSPTQQGAINQQVVQTIDDTIVTSEETGKPSRQSNLKTNRELGYLK